MKNLKLEQDIIRGRIERSDDIEEDERKQKLAEEDIGRRHLMKQSRIVKL